jgi:hypothetical protein
MVRIVEPGERLFSFPHPVNEYSARFVAGGVVMLTTAVLVLGHFAGPGWYWLLAPLAYGFVARVLTGPKLSPLGLFVTRVLVPRLGIDKPVAGPPKRFAQAMGVGFSMTALVLHFGFGATGAAQVVLGMLLGAATLESVFSVCLGCRIFAVLMKAGVIPESVCADCADFEARHRRTAARSA